MGTEGVRPSNSTVLRRFANAKLETGIPRQEKGTHPSSLTNEIRTEKSSENGKMTKRGRSGVRPRRTQLFVSRFLRQISRK